MPRSPRFTPAVAAMPESVFSSLESSVGSDGGQVFPLHVGDTWLEPFEGARMQDLDVAQHPGMHRYCATQGLPALLDAVVEKVRSRNRLPCERENALVAGGATGGLATLVGALASPGEEVLMLAPFWPLIRGIVQAFRAAPVEVPFYDRVDSAGAAVEAVRARLTSRTVALYVSTPSNPTGRVLPGDWLEALAGFARREDLWLISDEVYEDYVYGGEHVSIGRFAPERTASVFSFSKAYGMAGNRTGYLVAPAALAAQAHKVSVHTFYHAPTAGQLAAHRALADGAGWVENARASYREAGEGAAAELGLPAPEGSTFLFVDASRRLDGRGMRGFLEDCAADGVLVAPGASSGADYASWVRLCYTAMPPRDVKEAVQRLARRLR